MENKQHYTELELMRSQMEDFKAQLERQKIVNDKLIISSMKKNMSWIRKYVYFEFCFLSRSSHICHGSTTASSWR